MRRPSWQLLAAAALLVLLAVLATLQYRWLGDVSDAERERLRSGLRTRTLEFVQEFNAEIMRLYTAFRLDGDQLDAELVKALEDAYARWQAAANAPSLIQGIYLVDAQKGESGELRRFDLARRVIERVEWPPELRAWLLRADKLIPRPPGAPSPSLVDLPFIAADLIDSSIPAVLITIPRVKRIVDGGQLTLIAEPATSRHAIILTLDRNQLEHQWLESLVVKYFGEPARSDYHVTIARRFEPEHIVYASSDVTVDQAGADVTSDMFGLRTDELNRFQRPPSSSTLARGSARAPERIALTIVRRGAEGHTFMAAGAGLGAWQVHVRHRSGSLDAVVARSRRRNLAISLGVLGLLAASFILVIGSARRWQTLARQQMEFVASVSHELRTPLTVISSAGDNLADGVVEGREHVKRYGSLIRTESRRLSDMVDRVLEFAGINSGGPVRTRTEVDVSKLMADVVRSADAEARDRGIGLAVRVAQSLPPIVGDADALRSAARNIIANAIKYSPSGATVDVATEARDGHVRISVIDRGIGIDPEDLPHIFKPFYRGRRAVDAQIRGTGIGLSVVRHVIDGHDGALSVESRVGEGTTVCVTLPAARGAASPQATL